MSIKRWIKNSEDAYDFVVNENVQATIHFNRSSSDGIVTVNAAKETFKINRSGFWKSNIEITDTSNVLAASVKPAKWYSGHYIMQYNGQEYKLIVRNNPLAEWAIQQNDKDICAYGLDTKNGAVTVRITEAENVPVLFHFILWYLFWPIAVENTGDHLLFSLLLTA